MHLIVYIIHLFIVIDVGMPCKLRFSAKTHCKRRIIAKHQQYSHFIKLINKDTIKKFFDMHAEVGWKTFGTTVLLIHRGYLYTYMKNWNRIALAQLGFMAGRQAGKLAGWQIKC